MSDFRALLESYRQAAKTEKEKGTYFERITVEFIKNDPGMAQEYEGAWLYSDWARENGRDGKDTGIDVVAKMRDGGFCAIQCKFYKLGYAVQKSDIDSFFTASGKSPFTRRLIIDTTDAPWSRNADEALDGQQIETTRIGLDRLAESPIDWAKYLFEDTLEIAEKKKPRAHQEQALAAVREGLSEGDRGKLIMACGTGKTFTGLKIAEDMVGVGKTALFLVPSLSLMSQTIREWTIDSTTPLRAFAVCSDAQVGKRRRNADDVAEVEAHDLDYPATTNAAKLAKKVSHAAPDRMTVVFATYQSIQVVAAAQTDHGMPEFDLIICDEAHRTTGATFAGEEESHFVRVHDQTYLKGKKRLYMTATPRVFGDGVKAKANEASVELCSMDDESKYGATLFQKGFGWAVENGLLTDYKVVVLAVDEGMVSSSIQSRLAAGDNELKLDDATKIIGCYKALTKGDLKQDVGDDGEPMHRALAFCKDIASSKLIKDQFASVVADYLASEEGKETEAGRTPLGCELQHVDGTFNAKDRNRCLDWLKAEQTEDVCRILTNARCLSEGVDVPALDAILFMHPRKSQIDVVQSVGRVMRRAEGKKMGYVILPIGVPAGMSPEDALNDNERYRVVWQILNALRSHDERFDAMINKIDLGVDVGGQIEVIAVSNKLPSRADKSQTKANIGHGAAADDDDREDGSSRPAGGTAQFEFVFDEFSKAIMAKIVKKCGRRDYWENWAGNIASIAQKHIARIAAAVEKSGTPQRAAFDSFLAEVRDDLNDSISPEEAIEMLAQHLITRPVFEALFEDHSFAAKNPVSLAMQGVLDALSEENLQKEADDLEEFYASVRRRAAGIADPRAKQKIIADLYENFFRNAFPRMADRLGIVYTPVEIVDFIIKSVSEILSEEFGYGISDKNVHVIDPFTGTGTFIARLIQSGIIDPKDIDRKYAAELHANELILLAYYIAAVNIEAAYHSVVGGDYRPFSGICLTDTFQMYEADDLIDSLMPDNSERRRRQKQSEIRVIIGNPPYSSGQKNEHDNNKNISYSGLDERISSTFVQRSSNAMGKSKSYDSYIRAIRWATDRIGESGVVAFVVGSAWVERSFADGMRRCLADEHSSIYLINLRGDIRKQILSKGRAREGENVFGQNSMTGIVIAIFVKNPKSSKSGVVKYIDIGNDLSRSDKLRRISEWGSTDGASKARGWQQIVTDENGDWLDQRTSDFESLLPISSKRLAGAAGVDAASGLFRTYSMGIKSNRDQWVYNGSKEALRSNVSSMIAFYNSERMRLQGENANTIDKAVNRDSSRIKWTTDVLADLAKGKSHEEAGGQYQISAYRPFCKQWVYSSSSWNWSRHLMPSFFPDAKAKNRAICVSGVGARAGFSVLMVDVVPNLHILDTAQCFPLKIYEKGGKSSAPSFFEEEVSGVIDGISDEGFAEFTSLYGAGEFTKEDVFYYIYGVLHSEEYREVYRKDLLKKLPRVPRVDSIETFRAFSKAGRELADLHVNYEVAKPYPLLVNGGLFEVGLADDPESFYRVEKMKFSGKRGSIDKSVVVYNSNITLSGIPEAAHEYIVNGKSALEWVMERQVVKSDSESGIINDANRYALETVDDPAYPLKLFQRIVTVSLETMKIVRNLPPLYGPASVEGGGLEIG